MGGVLGRSFPSGAMRAVNWRPNHRCAREAKSHYWQFPLACSTGPCPALPRSETTENPHMAIIPDLTNALPGVLCLVLTLTLATFLLWGVGTARASISETAAITRQAHHQWFPIFSLLGNRRAENEAEGAVAPLREGDIRKAAFDTNRFHPRGKLAVPPYAVAVGVLGTAGDYPRA